jgi:UDP-glucose 4-epimerase
MRCLVTGHKGYIGSHLYTRLITDGHQVLGIDTEDENSGEISEVLSSSSRQKYLDFNPEIIFHLACWPRVAFSVENPLSTMMNNTLATSWVLDLAKEVKCKRFIYSSSSSVVGNGDGPESPYALQKLTSEIETTLYSKLYGIDTVSLRYFNVYSPDQKADGAYATAIANWMEYIRQGKDPFITGSGYQKRDMLNVRDVVAANIFAMEYGDEFTGGVYDTGTGTNISLNEMKEICHEYFPRVNFEYVYPRPGDVLETQAQPSSLFNLGWKTEVSIHDGIHECFKKLKDEIND